MKELKSEYLKTVSKKCRYDIVRMIENAGSGHIGGALSSVDIYVLLRYVMEDCDRLVVSHGHSAAAIYAVLGNMGYFDIEEAVASFRRKAPYEGHPSIYVNGIEWCSGSLGQGLSVGCGFALAKKLKKEPGKVYVVMGDGEQQKGQLQEAREFAVKHQLDNLIAIVDCNGLQASGTTEEIGGQSLRDKYQMSGWKTVTRDGHALDAMYDAIQNAEGPLCILAATTMGKGIPEIEGNYKYHGTLISKELTQLSLNRFRLTAVEEEILKGNVAGAGEVAEKHICAEAAGDSENISMENRKVYRKLIRNEYPKIAYTEKCPYRPGSMIEVRSAMGKALSDIAAENPWVPIAALDCDLEGSVKLADFKKERETSFIECGIAEHNAATVAAAMSKSGIIAVHADFSMFNIAETYSQNRMADINKAPVKLFCTHAGLDVGEDGKTHQSIDYISLLSNLPGFQVIVPADANQADCAVRYAMSVEAPVAIIAGRSKLSVLSYKNGAPLDFAYGKAQWLHRGTAGVIVTYGNLVHRALKIAWELEAEGIAIGVLNISTPIDIDREQIIKAAETGTIITYEDHNVKTGIGNYVARILCESGVNCKLLCKGVSKYGSSMPPEKLYAEQGLDEENMKKEIITLLTDQTT